MSDLDIKYLFDQMLEQQKQFRDAIERFSGAIEGNTSATTKLSEKITNLEQHISDKSDRCKACSITIFSRILIFLILVVGGIAIGREIFLNKDFINIVSKIIF